MSEQWLKAGASQPGDPGPGHRPQVRAIARLHPPPCRRRDARADVPGRLEPRRLTRRPRPAADGGCRLDRPSRRGLAPRCRVPPRLRRVLLDERPCGYVPTGSPLQTRVRQCLRCHRLPLPLNEYEVRDPAGTFIGRVDFAYPAERVLIEVQSWEWHAGKIHLDRDAARRARFAAAGWTVLEATAATARDFAPFAAGLRSTLRARAPTLPFL